MSLKIVPWLFVLSIALAYAFPSAQQTEEVDPNHQHDEHCGHPIKEAFNKVKQTISGAYNKTKATIGNAFEKLKKGFKKPEPVSTSAPAPVPDSSTVIYENPSLLGGDGSVSQNGDGFTSADGFVPAEVDPINTGSSDSSGRSNSNSNDQTSSTMSLSEIEAAIDPRLRGGPTINSQSRGSAANNSRLGVNRERF